MTDLLTAWLWHHDGLLTRWGWAVLGFAVASLFLGIACGSFIHVGEDGDEEF